MSKYQPYLEYRESEVEWFGKIPDHWKVKKLKFIANARPSNVDKKSKDGEKSVLLCNYTDVYYNDFITSDINFMEATATDEQIKKFHLEVGDVIITKDSEGPDDIAISAYVKETQDKLVCGYHLTHIKPISCDGNYLFRAFNSNGIHDQFKAAANGITRYGIGVYGIDNARFPTPPLQEQQTIANYLDQATAKIDTLIQQQERLIELLKEKRQALISHTVTKGLDPNVKMKDSEVEWIGEVPKHWEIKKFKYLFQIKKRIAGKLGYDILSITQKGIKVKDIESGAGQLSSDYSKYQHVRVGDYAMNHMDLLTGFVDLSQYDGVTSPDYRVFSLVHTKSSPDYYLYLLQMGYLNKLFYPFGQGSSHLGRWRLPTEAFNEFLAPCPPKQEQEEIAPFIQQNLHRFDMLTKKANEAITLLKERRTALISAVVTGKIDVRKVGT